MAIFNSSSSTSYSSKTGGRRDDTIKVGVDFTTGKGPLGGTQVKMATHAKSLASKNDFSLSTSSKIKSGPDQLGLKIGVGDWVQDPGDRDAFDFLICISGAKSGQTPTDRIKKPSDIDLRVDLNFGQGLEVAFTPDSLKDLKLVKCRDADGDLAWGYVGKVSDAKKLKLALKSEKTGKKLANMDIDLSVEEKGGDEDRPIKFPIDIFDNLGSF